MKNRDISISIRLAEDEAKRLRNYAKQCGLTQSDFMRMAIKGRQPKPVPPEVFWEHMNILYGIYDGLWNIAYSGGEDSDYAREMQSTLEKEILRLQAAVTLPEKVVMPRGGDENMGD